MGIEIDEELKIQLAKTVLDHLPEKQKLELLEKSLAKTMVNILSEWEASAAIKKQVFGYMVEYVKTPEIQAKLKAKTHIEVDNMLDKVTATIIKSSDDSIKSKYRSLGK